MQTSHVMLNMDTLRARHLGDTMQIFSGGVDDVAPLFHARVPVPTPVVAVPHVKDAFADLPRPSCALDRMTSQHCVSCRSVRMNLRLTYRALVVQLRVHAYEPGAHHRRGVARQE